MLGLRPEMLVQDSSLGYSPDTATLELALQRVASGLVTGIPAETLPATLESSQGFFSPDPDSRSDHDGGRSEGEMRSLYQGGQITDKNLSEALSRLGFREGRGLVMPGLTRSSLDHALLTRPDQRTEPSLRDWVLGLPWSEQDTSPLDDSWPLGEVCRHLYDPLATRAVRLVLVPCCGMFLQNGSGNRGKSFWEFFLGNVSIGGIRTSFGKSLEADACRRLGNRVGPAETALELLGLAHPSLGNLESAVRLTLQAHPGWAACFRQLGLESSAGDGAKAPALLMDFLAAVLLVEFHIAVDLAARSGHSGGKGPGSATALARSFRQGLASGASALELQREPWDLCLALQHLGYSRQILETLGSPESARELVRATRALSPWKRLAIWQEATPAGSPRQETALRPATRRAPDSDPGSSTMPLVHMNSPVQPTAPKDSPAAMRVLLVEDDPLIGRAVTKGLVESGHTCLWVKNGKAGLEECLTQRHDCVILDLMLPEVAGLDVLRQVRAKGVRTPVVILTALGAVEERVAGLRDGADDYLVKPFAFHELLARLEAVRRRSSNRPAPALQAGKISLDLTNRRVTCSGNQVDLTPTGFSLLEILMRNAGNIVTRRMLAEHLWEGDCESETNIIEVHVNRLRNKLSRAGAGDVIQTVRGRGYTLRPF